MAPMVGSKVWFKPRRFGWGWEPASWEGWLVTVLAIAPIVAVAVRGGTEESIVGVMTVAASGALIAICVVKGTSPGGPDRHEEFERRRGDRRGGLPGVRTDDPELDTVLDNLKRANRRPGPR